MATTNDSVNGMIELCGFDPRKESLGKDAIAEAIVELRQERGAKLKARAKELILKIHELLIEEAKLDAEYKKKKEKSLKDRENFWAQIKRAQSEQSDIAKDDPEPAPESTASVSDG